jgi:hypothetical protein
MLRAVIEDLGGTITDAIFRGDRDPFLTAAELIASLGIDWRRY